PAGDAHFDPIDSRPGDGLLEPLDSVAEETAVAQEREPRAAGNLTARAQDEPRRQGDRLPHRPSPVRALDRKGEAPRRGERIETDVGAAATERVQHGRGIPRRITCERRV